MPDTAVQTITSRQHPFVSRCRAAAAGQDGRSDVLLDGAHLLRDALDAGIAIDTVAVTPEAAQTREVTTLLTRMEGSRTTVLAVSANVMDALSPVRTPAGVVAIARLVPRHLQDALAGPQALAVAVVGVQDPGNVGAIIRAADAAGATGVVVTTGSASPFGWKALRGAMGSAFRVPIAADVPLSDLWPAAAEAGLRSVATVPSAGHDLWACDLAGPTMILVGGEGPGLDAVTTRLADEQLRIPMAHGVESLNVAVATGVILFEARRQRSVRRTGQR